MNWSRAQLAFAIGVVFLVLAVVVQTSAAFLAVVGWVMLLVVAPAFFLAARLRRR